jgi:hypothetical protein
MLEANLIELFIRPLEENNIEYMITGSVAAIVYGEPRLTNDIDLVFHLHQGQIEHFHSLFSLEHFYCPPLETIILESKRESRAHFNIIHHESGFKADCYLAGQDPLQKWGLTNRRRIEFTAELSLWLAPPEYVILKKLEYYREGGSEKHIRDIANILLASSDEVNKDFLEGHIVSLGLMTQWEKVLEYKKNAE